MRKFPKNIFFKKVETTRPVQNQDFISEYDKHLFEPKLLSENRGVKYGDT